MKVVYKYKKRKDIMKFLFVSNVNKVRQLIKIEMISILKQFYDYKLKVMCPVVEKIKFFNF